MIAGIARYLELKKCASWWMGRRGRSAEGAELGKWWYCQGTGGEGSGRGMCRGCKVQELGGIQSELQGRQDGGCAWMIGTNDRNQTFRRFWCLKLNELGQLLRLIMVVFAVIQLPKCVNAEENLAETYLSPTIEPELDQTN